MKINRFWQHTFESSDFGLYTIEIGDKELIVKPEVRDEGKTLRLIEENEGLLVATLSVELEESKTLQPGYFYAPMWQEDKKNILEQLVDQGFLEPDANERQVKTPNGIAKAYRILSF